VGGGHRTAGPGNMPAVSELASHVAARPLLTELVDHAALFPPAAMDMEAALAEDGRARASEDAWLIGRFVCLASRLDELLAAGPPPPRLSVILDGELETALGRAAGARERGARVEAVEARGAADAVREGVAATLGGGVPAYAEGVPPAALPAGVHAKLRCGGERPQDVPSAAAVAAFIAECHDHGVAFKATAGLHHPIRHADPASGGRQHGFLNFLAAALVAAVDGGDGHRLAEVLELEEPAAVLELLARFDAAAAADVRASLFHGIGSCSWREPAGDLRALGVLPA